MAEATPLNNIWECDKMISYIDEQSNKKKMKCLHCGLIAACNATKLLHHAAKIRGGDIKICTAAHPEENQQQLYQKMIADKMLRKQSNHDAQIAIVAQQEQTAAAYAQVGTKRRVASMDDSGIDVDSGDQHLTVTSSSKERARNMRQSQLVTSIPSTNNIEKMDTAIADFLLSNALSPH